MQSRLNSACLTVQICRKNLWKIDSWLNNTLNNNTIRCKKLTKTIVSGRKYVARPFVRRKQVSTSAVVEGFLHLMVLLFIVLFNLSWKCLFVVIQYHNWSKCPNNRSYLLYRISGMHLPLNILLISRGRSPWGESFPPSMLKPSPVASFKSSTIINSESAKNNDNFRMVEWFFNTK